jgi:hypothetical protein
MATLPGPGVAIDNGLAFEVILPDGQIPSTFVVGEDVYVYGAERHGVITAVGISELSPMK